MLPFFGHEKVSIDSNGRVKLSPRFASDFREYGNGNGQIVLFCLPEGGLAVYPEEIFLQMRRAEAHPAERAAESLLQRRKMRLSGAMTHSDSISNQGRITIPHFLREHTGLHPNIQSVMVGVEIGLEIWTLETWASEFGKARNHANEKGELEMASDLYCSKKINKGDEKL
jgi:DNA-binding transcriptional regulator/RsmH inhibitor MraZ